MKKLFHYSPLIEIENCHQFKFIGDYQFLEASNTHCQFTYENYSMTIQGEKIHIDLMREKEIIIRVEKLVNLNMEKQELHDGKS